jgi:hypothetical protein
MMLILIEKICTFKLLSVKRTVTKPQIGCVNKGKDIIGGEAKTSEEHVKKPQAS